MLLDTHVWRWHSAGDTKRIGPRTRREIDRAVARGGAVVSAASMFEMAALSAAGRLHLAPSAEAWMRTSVELGRLRISDVTSAIAIEAGSIPAVALPDPMDRLLVATARQLDIPIVTRDGRILDYIRMSRIGRAIDAGR